jgi:RHS repeat-associated protein
MPPGTIVWLWNSDPYGLGFADSDPDGDGQGFVYNLRLPGQYADAETGLNYNYHRDYDPSMGRYVESDPVGLGGGSYSTYGYVGANPILFADPSGLRIDYDGYTLSNWWVRTNLALLNALIVGKGIDNNCFVLLVTGGDRYRDSENPKLIRSVKNNSVITNASPHSPHLRERGARAVDFVIRNQKGCGCTPVTDSLVNELLPETGFDVSSTARDYPDGPHTHLNLPNWPIYYPSGGPIQ